MPTGDVEDVLVGEAVAGPVRCAISIQEAELEGLYPLLAAVLAVDHHHLWVSLQQPSQQWPMAGKCLWCAWFIKANSRHLHHNGGAAASVWAPTCDTAVLPVAQEYSMRSVGLLSQPASAEHQVLVSPAPPGISAVQY